VVSVSLDRDQTRKLNGPASAHFSFHHFGL
jgi:hypothetical protein